MARFIRNLAANVMIILHEETDGAGNHRHDFEIQERFNMRLLAEQFMEDLENYGSRHIVNIKTTSTGFVYAWEVYTSSVGQATMQRPTIGNVKRVTFRIDMDNVDAPTDLAKEVEGMQELLSEFSPVIGYTVTDESEMLRAYFLAEGTDIGREVV